MAAGDITTCIRKAAYVKSLHIISRTASRPVLPKQQSLFIMHDPKPNAVEPPTSPDKCVRRIAHCMKENNRGPFQTESLYCDFARVP